LRCKPAYHGNADRLTLTIPVVALAAYAVRGDELKASDAGCDGYITKPIDTRSLVEKLSALIDAVRARPPAK
jgi:CheY-like chemotaxis protein